MTGTGPGPALAGDEGEGAPYPRFSPEEMERRRLALEAALAERGIDQLLAYGAERSGSAVQWLTGWPVTREGAVVLAPGREPVLVVQFYNHVPNARLLAQGTEVRWGGASTIGTAIEALRASGAGLGRIGVIGPFPARLLGPLSAAVGEVVFLDDAYTGLRLVKSEEELAWVRTGASLTDKAVASLAAGAEVGATETELCALIESAYLGSGGVNHIHYLSATPMSCPASCVPAQWPSRRPLRAGDALVCEVSASYWGYPGQLLRTFTVATDPTPLYERLHEVASAALAEMLSRLGPGATAAQVAEGAAVIEDSGFFACDDLLHGFVGGYLPPVIAGPGRPGPGGAGAVPDLVFEPGMTVVVQPNVVTRDARAGVQTGELVLVTEEGWAPLHRFPPGLGRIG